MRASKIRTRAQQDASHRNVVVLPNDPADVYDRTADQLFRDDLLDRWSVGHPRCLSNVDLATLAWRAWKAGSGGVEDLAVNPASKGRNHGTRVRKALRIGAVTSQIQKASVPVWCCSTTTRAVRILDIKLPHAKHWPGISWRTKLHTLEPARTQIGEMCLYSATTQLGHNMGFNMPQPRWLEPL